MPKTLVSNKRTHLLVLILNSGGANHWEPIKWNKLPIIQKLMNKGNSSSDGESGFPSLRFVSQCVVWGIAVKSFDDT